MSAPATAARQPILTVRALLGDGGVSNPVVRFLVATNKDGTEILPEGMINIDGGLTLRRL